MEQFAEAAGAAIGGFVSSSTLFPVEIIKTKAAAEKDKNMTVFKLAKKEYDRVGISGLYNGAHVGGLQSAMEKFLYFYNFKTITAVYIALRNRLNGTSSKQVGFLADIVIGYLAEWSHLPVSLPADAIQTRMKVENLSFTEALGKMQAEVGTDHPAGKGRKKTHWDVFYKVLFPFVILCLKPAIQNTIFERVKAIVLRYKAKASGGVVAVAALTAVEAFFVGAIARAVATLVVFPYNRIKILLQTSGKAKSSGKVAAGILQADGVLGFWRGVGPDISRGVVSAAMMLAVKEKIQLVIKTLLGVAPVVPKK